jgi:hypothetical protein
MPVKLRIAKQRRPLFSLEVLELFIHLEGIRDEDSREFQDGSKRLAQLLNLGAEYLCSCTSVTHRELHHSMPNDDYPSAQDWLRVRRVRLQLLAAAAALNGRHHNGPSAVGRRSTVTNPTTTNDISDHTNTIAAPAHRPGEP